METINLCHNRAESECYMPKRPTTSRGKHNKKQKKHPCNNFQMVRKGQNGTKRQKIPTYISSSEAVMGQEEVDTFTHLLTGPPSPMYNTSYSRALVFNEGQFCSREHCQRLETLFVVTMGENAIEI